ncbi:MAG: hypothetical protein V3W34_06455 [Phycisphaerae bacterium]
MSDVPKWLSIIAWKVDELVLMPRVGGRFDRILVAWKREREKNRGRRDRYLPDLPIPLPERKLTLPERYAILAALHNHICKSADPIDPWADEEETGPPRKRGKKKKVLPYTGTPFYGLTFDAKLLCHESPDEVRAVLKAVLHDLRKVRLLTTAKVNAIIADVQREQEDGDSALTAVHGRPTGATNRSDLDSVHAVNRGIPTPPLIKLSQFSAEVRRTKGAVRKAMGATDGPRPFIKGKPGQPDFYSRNEMREWGKKQFRIDIDPPPVSDKKHHRKA